MLLLFPLCFIKGTPHVDFSIHFKYIKTVPKTPASSPQLLLPHKNLGGLALSIAVVGSVLIAGIAGISGVHCVSTTMLCAKHFVCVRI
jgi:hypothetical protein